MATPSPAAPAARPPAASRSLAGAGFALAVLFSMNLLNYIDRYIPSSVKDLFKTDLHFTDAQTSYPLSAFIIVYMLTSPLFGALADRWSRRGLIALGVGLWSLATAAAAFATGFWSFLAARALVGVGEAAYATLAPVILSDFHHPERRNRILTIFYIAIPVGSAIGFKLGGFLGPHFGWRAAFLIVGLPGLLAAALVLLMRDPGRGTFDADRAEAPPRWSRAIPLLLRNREYMFAVVGYTAVTFASGALADWFPTFLSRHRGFSLADADGLVGATLVLGGLTGNLAGGFLADGLRARWANAYFGLSWVSMALSAACAVLALRIQGHAAITAAIFLAIFFMWFYNGPINTIIANSVSGVLRARAFAFSIFAIHVLGDAASPSVVGKVSDLSSLPLAISLVPIAMAVGAVVWAVGWRMLPPTSPAKS